MKHILLLAGLTLAGCTTAQVSQTIADGQLFCAVGQTTVALAQASPSGVSPVIARGASSVYVQTACRIAGGIAVSPPANAGGAPVLTIPAVSVPL